MNRHLASALVLSIFVLLAVGSSGPDENDPQFRKDMAIETSKEFVLKQLKAPATAQWPRGSANYSCVELGDDQYRVTSYVDAQNSFGAQIRTFYTVVVKYQGNGQWSLVSIETQP